MCQCWLDQIERQAFALLKPETMNPMESNWFKCKFTKNDLDGKKVAYRIPIGSRGKIGRFEVRENSNGELQVKIEFVTIKDGVMSGERTLLSQDLIDRIDRNSDAKIPADFIVREILPHAPR